MHYAIVDGIAKQNWYSWIVSLFKGKSLCKGEYEMFIRIKNLRINLNNVSLFTGGVTEGEGESKDKYSVCVQYAGLEHGVFYDCDSKDHMEKVLENMDRCVSLGRSEKAKELYYVDKE